MRPRLFTLTSFLSLVLGLATCVLWMQGQTTWSYAYAEFGRCGVSAVFKGSQVTLRAVEYRPPCNRRRIGVSYPGDGFSRLEDFVDFAVVPDPFVDYGYPFPRPSLRNPCRVRRKILHNSPRCLRLHAAVDHDAILAARVATFVAPSALAEETPFNAFAARTGALRPMRV